MEGSSLLRHYRTDRRKILDYILRSDLINQIRTPTGTAVDVSDLDLDTLSVDYVLDCVKLGEVVDTVEATKKYYDEGASPVMIHSSPKDSFYLLSDPDLSGSPPRCMPPPIIADKSTTHMPHTSRQRDPLNLLTSTSVGVNYHENLGSGTHPKATEVPSLGLQSLKSELSGDNLHETAYEVLLASMAFSGIEIHRDEYGKRDKSSKLLQRFMSKKDKLKTELPSQRDLELITTVRVQMQISEAMDGCIRKSLMKFASRNVSAHISVPQISLGLLSGISMSDFHNEKSYMQWKNRQANVLEEYLCFSSDLTPSEKLIIRSSIKKIRNAKEWDTTMTPKEQAEVISAVRRITLKHSSVPGKSDMHDESTGSYHMNIRLYERLLFGIFDVLEESQLAQEANDVLMLIKMTWATLGITQQVHEALYGWVLFQQFSVTDDAVLLENTISQVQKVLSIEDGNKKESPYINSPVCSTIYNDIELKLSLVEAIFFAISIWCDKKLQDYHLHFSQKPGNFKRVINLASEIGLLASESSKDMIVGLNAKNPLGSTKLEVYIELSTKAAYWRVADVTAFESKEKWKHPLALLANEIKLIAEKEFNVFFPFLCHWCPKAGLISAWLLHQLYGERLKSFLQEVSSLSEDVRSVLPAADMLDRALTSLYTSSSDKVQSHRPHYVLQHYQIGEVSRPLILDWVIAQHTQILEWTGRAFALEKWEPLSFQQRHATSSVEVFRIIEENADQLFGMNLPMDISHLQALLSIIFHSLDYYIREIINQLVDKNNLIPTPPPLTRYTETVIPKAKKKLVQNNILDDNVILKLSLLTSKKLCVRLNSLHYIDKQLYVLEDSIRSSWELVRPSIINFAKEELSEISKSNLSVHEAVDAVFFTTFNSIRESITSAINQICDFAGTKVVFWDMRDSFLFRLYHGNVEDCRLDGILPQVDKAIDQICSLIDDTLRDHVVLSICRALLAGFVLVILDGGPSRAFSDSDIILMEEDLSMLKEFFVADGEGLPRFSVAEEAKMAEHVLSLFSVKTQTLVQMLMAASDDISTNTSKHQSPCFDDAHTLLRVLSHKKDREASKFLKKKYQLPMSSEYEEIRSDKSISRSPFISDLMNRSASFHLTNGHSFRSIKKTIEEATSEMRHAAADRIGSSRW